MRVTPLHRAASLAALLGLTTASAGLAQTTLRGRVVDSETGQAIAKARVRITGDTVDYVTDREGRFATGGLSGTHVDLTVRALGYAPATFHESLTAEDTLRVLALDFTGYNLPEVVVKGRAEELAPRYTDFERRRETGGGTYLRWDDLIKLGSNSLGDALRTVHGVHLTCRPQAGECEVAMARSPRCPPTWWVDGVRVQSFTESTPVLDIYGVEIYRGPAEVPGEFAGADAGCGVIAVWTKSRPYRQP